MPGQGAELPGAGRSLWALSLVPWELCAALEVAAAGVTPHSRGRGLEVCTDLSDNGIVGCCFNPVEQSVC